MAGLALVFTIKLLDLTVAIGSINGLILYANIVWANQDVLLSIDEAQLGFGQFLRIFLAWLNLDLGITACFFDGMNAYWKIWLQFAFPLYIWGITTMIIIASNLSFKASKFFGNTSIQVLATLFLLSFSKILQTVITVLSFTHLYYPNDSIAVWTEDGTLKYLSPAHGVLFTMALACLVIFWSPFALSLLLIQPLRRVSHHFPFRWVNKWKPFFDAYTGPLKDRYHYWTGFLLLSRAVLTITNATTTARASLLVAAIITSVLSVESTYKHVSEMVFVNA